MEVEDEGGHQRRVDLAGAQYRRRSEAHRGAQRVRTSDRDGRAGVHEFRLRSRTQRNALPEKYNFQIHQLYLVQRTLPAGEEQPCSFHGMIQNPEEIRLFHYSAERKPSYVLMHIMDEETGNLSTLGVSCQQDYPAGSSGTSEWKPCVPEYTEPSAQK